MDIKVRLAQKADLPAIIEISKSVYEGHDYFPQVFLKWLRDSSRKIFVAESRGVVIGVRAFHIIDGNETVVSQSLRVHPACRGHGVSSVLIRAEQQYVQAHFKCVKTERYTTMSTNVRRLAMQRKSFGENRVLELGIVAFCVNELNQDALMAKCANFTELRSIDSAEFLGLLRDGKLKDILEKNTFVIDLEPFKGLACNISCGLINDNDCLLVSEEKQERLVDIRCFSHGRLSPRVKCLHWVATMYTKNIQSLKHHIAKQFEHGILQASNRKFIFSCFLPTCFASEAKEFISEEFALDYVDFFDFDLLLFERQCQVGKNVL